MGPDLLQLAALGAVLEWPDRRRRFPLAGGRYLMGNQPLTTSRSGKRLTIEFRAGDQPGTSGLLAGISYGGYRISQFRVF